MKTNLLTPADCIVQELEKYGQKTDLSKVLEEKEEIRHPKVFAEYIPELQACMGFCQNNPHHIYDVFSHTIHALESCASDDLILKLAVLFHDIGKPLCYSEDENGIGHFYRHAKVGSDLTNEIMERLGFHHDIIEKTVQLIHYHDAVLKAKGKNIRKWIQKIGEEQFLRLLKVRRADIMGQNPVYWEQDFAKLDKVQELALKLLTEKPAAPKIRLAVNGRDLIAIGYTPGKELGAALKELEILVAAGKIENSREKLLETAAFNHSTAL